MTTPENGLPLTMTLPTPAQGDVAVFGSMRAAGESGGTPAMTAVARLDQARVSTARADETSNARAGTPVQAPLKRQRVDPAGRFIPDLRRWRAKPGAIYAVTPSLSAIASTR